MNPYDLVGIPCVTPPLDELLIHVIPEHSRDITNFISGAAIYVPTFTIIHRYRDPSLSLDRVYTELKFFWKKQDGTSGNNSYYFNASVCQILKPIAEPKRKLESFIQRKRI